MVKSLRRAYTVEGLWPFPTDMLRHDGARPARQRDKLLIERLSGEFTDNGFGLHEKVRINLTMFAGEPHRGRPRGRFIPNWKRWESFGWSVLKDEDVDLEKGIAARIDRDKQARSAALAKLTPDDMRVLGIRP